MYSNIHFDGTIIHLYIRIQISQQTTKLSSMANINLQNKKKSNPIITSTLLTTDELYQYIIIYRQESYLHDHYIVEEKSWNMLQSHSDKLHGNYM